MNQATLLVPPRPLDKVSPATINGTDASSNNTTHDETIRPAADGEATVGFGSSFGSGLEERRNSANKRKYEPLHDAEAGVPEVTATTDRNGRTRISRSMVSVVLHDMSPFNGLFLK